MLRIKPTWIVDVYKRQQSVRLGHGRKDLAALADPDHALLRRVRLCDLDHRNGVFLHAVVGSHIEIDRLAVQRVAVGCGNCLLYTSSYKITI